MTISKKQELKYLSENEKYLFEKAWNATGGEPSKLKSYYDSYIDIVIGEKQSFVVTIKNKEEEESKY